MSKPRRLAMIAGVVVLIGAAGAAGCLYGYLRGLERGVTASAASDVISTTAILEQLRAEGASATISALESRLDSEWMMLSVRDQKGPFLPMLESSPAKGSPMMKKSVLYRIEHPTAAAEPETRAQINSVVDRYAAAAR